MVLLLGAVAMLLLENATALLVEDSFSCVQVPRDLSGGLPGSISGATLGVLDSIAEEF